MGSRDSTTDTPISLSPMKLLQIRHWSSKQLILKSKILILSITNTRSRLRRMPRLRLLVLHLLPNRKMENMFLEAMELLLLLLLNLRKLIREAEMKKKRRKDRSWILRGCTRDKANMNSCVLIAGRVSQRLLFENWKSGLRLHPLLGEFDALPASVSSVLQVFLVLFFELRTFFIDSDRSTKERDKETKSLKNT